MSPFGGSGEDHMTPNEVDDTTIVSQPRGGKSGAEQKTHTQSVLKAITQITNAQKLYKYHTSCTK